MIKNNNIGVVIPCYNEEKRLPIDDFERFYKKNHRISFCFVNDGSTDATLKILHGFSKNKDRVYVIDLKENQGKSGAVRAGMLFFSEKDSIPIIGYFDADLSTPLEEIFLLEEAFQKEEIVATIGSRVKRLGANYYRNAKRHYFGRVFATFASIILKLAVYDTQCGAKLFKKEYVNNLFTEKFISKWIFDVEIFARLIQQIGIEKVKKNIYEIPLNTWIEKGDSKIKLTHILKVPFELFKIRKYYHL